MTLRCFIAVVLCFVLVPAWSGAAQNGSTQPVVSDAASPWTRLVSSDEPALWWRFDREHPLAVRTGGLDAKRMDPASATGVGAAIPGVSRSDSRLFGRGNTAAAFNGRTSVLKFRDPGTKSAFDFDSGDAITIEAWIRLDRKPGGFAHILSKGRTGNKGFPAGNQNYAFRIDGGKGDPRLSFLFRNRVDKVTKSDDFHRWTSDDSFVADGRWHHVALVYEFGNANSIRGYIDGQPTAGRWDLKGATSKPPIVDDDELWVGSALGGNPGSTFNGLIDEIVVYRKALSSERIAKRYPFVPRPLPPPMPETAPPRGEILVEVITGVPDKPVWPKQLRLSGERYREPAFAFYGVPPKYNSKGLRTDRSNPLILRASSRMTFEPGEYRLLLRTLRFGRVLVDGKKVLETPERGHRSTGHNALYDLASKLAPESRQLYPGAVERLAKIRLDGEHEIRVELLSGGQGRRLELGETSLSIANGDGPFRVLSPKLNIPLTDAGWTAYETTRRKEWIGINATRRRLASRQEDRYWEARHEAARVFVTNSPIEVPAETGGENNSEIDRFILRRLADENVEAAPLVDDWQFLRRVSLDVIGTPPSPKRIAEFFATPPETRRRVLIDRLLDDPRWADHWVGYWQDVLAENPNIIKPTLNNTGPFRWWVFESFLDNKPFDRFATELILMEGSQKYGGPGGFEVATQNDAPFAAKAHIIGQAFLGLEMKCARCHDAPYHDFSQKDLFSVAAMLSRTPQGVPKTSTIPGGASNSDLVTLSLKPGETVGAAWPFSDRLNTDVAPGFRRQHDSRGELAARVTSPHNDRFAQAIVNRMWQRYLGRGIVESVDDWHGAEPSHPDLLAWLGRELVLSGYDLKHMARLILNSQTYHRAVLTGGDAPDARLFAAPIRRRLSAEQLVDSLFAISGKQLRAGDMNIDHDGSNAAKSMINLGIPHRAWMFSSTSNERDRPSLALPFAQPFVTMLETFGWRSSRQNPLTIRDEELTVLQPAILANGVLGRRFSRLSDDSAFTRLALQEQPVSELVRAVYEHTLTRPPSSEERALFVEFLTAGYSDRIDASQLDTPPPLLPGVRRTGVGWSNHLTGAASDVQIAAEGIVRQGDPPTKKLHADWRERFEDMLWTLMNSPEFIFVP